MNEDAPAVNPEMDKLLAVWSCVMALGTKVDFDSTWNQQKLMITYNNHEVAISAFYSTGSNQRIYVEFETNFLLYEYRLERPDSFKVKRSKVKLPHHTEFMVVDAQGPWSNYVEQVMNFALREMKENGGWDGKAYDSPKDALEAAVVNYFATEHNIIYRGRTVDSPPPMAEPAPATFLKQKSLI